MKKRWAFLTMVIALVAGAAAGLLFMQPARAPMHLSLSCMLLAEAEKAGYVSREKRSALIEKLATSASLNATDREYVPRLGSECPKM